MPLTTARSKPSRPTAAIELDDQRDQVALRPAVRIHLLARPRRGRPSSYRLAGSRSIQTFEEMLPMRSQRSQSSWLPLARTRASCQRHRMSAACPLADVAHGDFTTAKRLRASTITVPPAGFAPAAAWSGQYAGSGQRARQKAMGSRGYPPTPSCVPPSGRLAALATGRDRQCPAHQGARPAPSSTWYRSHPTRWTTSWG